MGAFDLSEEVQALTDPDSYSIPHEHDPTEEDPVALLEAAVEAVAESSSAITDPETFDVYRSLLKHSSNVPGPIMSKLLDSITSGMYAELDSTKHDVDAGDPQVYMEHKTPLEMYAFLLQWFVTAAEKVKGGEDEDGPAATQAKGKRGRGGKAGGRAGGRGGGKKGGMQETWTWVNQIEPTLQLIVKVLSRVHTQRIWTITAERDAFVGCLTRPAYHVSESELYMKNEKIRMAVYRVICLAVKSHAHTMRAQIAIIQNLTFYEHLSEHFAELLSILVREFAHHQLGDEVLREIAGKKFGAADSKGPRVFGRFLVKYAELCPQRVKPNMSLLLQQLDSEAYPMRVALIEVIGYIITELASSLDPDAPPAAGVQPGDTQDENEATTTDPKVLQRQISDYFSLLLERTLDVSSYVRAKVFNVSLRLLTLRQKFPKHRLQLTKIAVGCLEDKAASVRKGSVTVLCKLLDTHPYGLAFGGFLEREEWEREYAVVREKLEEMERAFDVQGLGVVDEGDEDEEEEDEEEDEEEGMDVDGEEEEDEEDEVAMDIDPESQSSPPRPSKKSSKSKKSKSKKPPKPRPSKPRLSVPATQAAIENLDQTQLQHLKLKKKYFVEALDFIRQIEGCMEKMGELLGSKNKPEVLEAMEFFKLAWEFKIVGAKVGLKKMLHLIWTKDPSATTTTVPPAKSTAGGQAGGGGGGGDEEPTSGESVKGIRSRLLECYKQLYFDPLNDPEMSAKDQVNRIAKNMIERTYEATLAELTSLEEMMRIMHEEGYVHEDIIAKLWQVYSSSRPLPKPQRRGAIIILGMLALARRSVVKDKVDVMLKVGLGGLGKQDLTLARYTCVALQRLTGSHKKVKGSLLDKSQRIPMDSPIFQKLRNAIERPCRSKDWFPLAEQAINTIYALGDHPDELCTDIIKRLTVRAFTPKAAAPPSEEGAEGSAGAEGEGGDGGEGGEGISTQPPSSTQTPAEGEDPDAMDEDPPVSAHPDATQASAFTPTAPFSTQSQSQSQSQGGGGGGGGPKDVGDAFELSQLLFVVGHVAIKQIVYLELVERELKRQKDEKVAAEKLANKDKHNTSKDGEELDQVVGNAEDEIGERIATIRETELLFGEGSLLAVYGPILVQICGKPGQFKNKTLRAAATLSLSKFLCVSSAFCEAHHTLLFKILDTSKDPNIKSNIVIALGDVAVSFSNIIDENTNELYKGLKDPDPGVKKNTLMVLTHLILNGMVKVKGQLGEMAKCIEDPDPRIVDLAKLFFEELSTKENAIYNNLPDVISHLSTGDHAVSEEAFQNILKYIFKFVEKEKQAENIVQKLCERFRLSEDPRQWRDIAFCLSLLQYKSERSVKKLVEGLPHYRDKLYEAKVYEYFAEILKTARSNKGKDKPDNDLDDFERILAENKAQGEEDNALEKRATKKRAAAKKKAGRGRPKAAAPPPPVDDEEEFVDD